MHSSSEKRVALMRAAWRPTIWAGLALLAAGWVAANSGGIAFAGPGFTAKSFKGSYALGFSGTDLTIGPIAGTGVLSSDGKGNVKGTQTIKDGATTCTESLGGTYSVNPDGTGDGSVTVTGTTGSGICQDAVGNVITFSLVLWNSHGESKIKLSETSPNYVILGEGDRQCDAPC